MKHLLVIVLVAIGISAAILAPKLFTNRTETEESARVKNRPSTEHEPRWEYFVQLRPDQLQEIVDKTPVVYWPLGIIEHHGWALPVGFDGLRVERQCRRMIRRTGGVMMPVMWYGGGGLHGQFKWTFCQPMDAAKAIFARTINKMIDFGFTCIVVMPGHGPWSYILEEVLPPIAAAHPEVLIVGMPDPKAKSPPKPAKSDKPRGSHAERVETAMGLALMPELVDMNAFEAPRDLSKVWPASGRVPKDFVSNPPVNFDETSPCFAQSGEDGRLAKAKDVEAQLAAHEDRVVKMVNKHLGR